MLHLAIVETVELKSLISKTSPVVVAAFVWHFWASAQEKLPSKADRWSAAASCYEESTGKLVGSSSSRTPVLVSSDGRYGAYAESDAVASDSANTSTPECQNTSRLFVAGPKKPQVPSRASDRRD